MENKLGTVSDVKILSSDKKARVKGGTYITFLTEKNITKDKIVDVVINDRTHHFKTSDIEIHGQDLQVTAREVGYWARKIDNIDDFDLRKVIGLEVELITDEVTLRQIETESCWC